MTVTRRVMLVGLAAAGGAIAGRTDACTLVATQRKIAFSDDTCRRELRDLVALINTAPSLTDAALAERLSDTSIRFDEDVSDPILNYPRVHPIEDTDLIRGWSMSDGKRDRTPLRLTEVTLLKGERGFGLYQFTLRRDRFMAEITEEQAASDSCGFPEPAHWYREDRAYLAAFRNNKLRQVSGFDVWLRGA